MGSKHQIVYLGWLALFWELIQTVAGLAQSPAYPRAPQPAWCIQLKISISAPMPRMPQIKLALPFRTAPVVPLPNFSLTPVRLECKLRMRGNQIQDIRKIYLFYHDVHQEFLNGQKKLNLAHTGPVRSLTAPMHTGFTRTRDSIFRQRA
ncbi:hypothetical protein L0128_07690 [candidate division KSB1 bacterium]|nr:hypothetical protein [candidate division KSB1 bacterium]